MQYKALRHIWWHLDHSIIHHTWKLNGEKERKTKWVKQSTKVEEKSNTWRMFVSSAREALILKVREDKVSLFPLTETVWWMNCGPHRICFSEKTISASTTCTFSLSSLCNILPFRRTKEPAKSDPKFCVLSFPLSLSLSRHSISLTGFAFPFSHFTFKLLLSQVQRDHLFVCVLFCYL